MEVHTKLTAAAQTLQLKTITCWHLLRLTDLRVLSEVLGKASQCGQTTFEETESFHKFVAPTR